MPGTSPALADLAGLWRRSLLVDERGRDTTSSVTWVQGPARYADLRQPAGLSPPRGTGSLADLSFEQLLDLAGQEAFAGRLRHAEGAFHWGRTIDYQPPAALPDAGRLEWHGPVLVEKGLHAPYVEHWHPAEEAGGSCAAAELVGPRSGRAGLLVRAGSWFGYARGRSEPLPAHASLAELVAGAGHLGRARELLDCEVSLGRITGDRWIVERSTLPHREGRSLAPALAGGAELSVSDTGPGGTAYQLRWEISAAEGPLHVLAGS
ncbi:hypothetical protein [Streptomyces sp. AC555_RSS877]|uniref:hypothetical protein n=1 Tax=Streptomyces sp. AC555_RSS877 TaxID=2823688 RepID=UPI001C25A5C4|nr:hypothetical protein [Streptomyces sp. AC555_RSS877]